MRFSRTFPRRVPGGLFGRLRMLLPLLLLCFLTASCDLLSPSPSVTETEAVSSAVSSDVNAEDPTTPADEPHTEGETAPSPDSTESTPVSSPAAESGDIPDEPDSEVITQEAVSETVTDRPAVSDTESETASEPEPATEPVTEPETHQPHVHAPVNHPEVSPSCTEGGTGAWSSCGDCGAVLSEAASLAPLGHSYTAYRCTRCGDFTVCPPPRGLMVSGTPLPFGVAPSLSWDAPEGALHTAEYRVTLRFGSGDEITLAQGLKETEFTVSVEHLPESGDYTVGIYAAYPAVEGGADTESPAVTVNLTVLPPVPLTPPAFSSEGEVTVEPGQSLTVSWLPPADEGGDIRYSLYLQAGESAPVLLGEGLTALSFTVDGSLLATEGSYTLLLYATDAAGRYLPAEAVTLSISAAAPPPYIRPSYTDPSAYASDHYYQYLGTLEKGAYLQAFYDRMDAVMAGFHDSGENAKSVSTSSGSTYRYAGIIRYSDLGLTLEEAASVRIVYAYDHPLYYWLSNTYVYTNTSLYLCVESDYAVGANRQAANRLVYEGVEAMSQGMLGESSPYRIALAFYEAILTAADYAYEEDGVTPEQDSWAYSIIGVFGGHGKVVCEGFAETYSLLLNLHGVENMPVSGVSRGVGHMWNLIRVDDGQWYWCDATWDDPVTSELGMDYKYFCVNDTQDVLYYYVRDGIEAGRDYTFEGSATFLDDHDPRWTANLILDMSGAIPARAETPYSADGSALRETFSVDGMTYAVVGYRKVQVVDFGSSKRIHIPEAVSFGGVEYTVVSIGLISEDGIYMTGRMLPYLSTAQVYVPKTVYYIWDGALQGFFVTVTVDPENPYLQTAKGNSSAKTAAADSAA